MQKISNMVQTTLHSFLKTYSIPKQWNEFHGREDQTWVKKWFGDWIFVDKGRLYWEYQHAMNRILDNLKNFDWKRTNPNSDQHSIKLIWEEIHRYLLFRDEMFQPIPYQQYQYKLEELLLLLNHNVMVDVNADNILL